jgi:hypothetical protein
LNDHHRVEEAEGIEPTESRLRPDTVSLVAILPVRSNLLVWWSRRFKQPKQPSALGLARAGTAQNFFIILDGERPYLRRIFVLDFENDTMTNRQAGWMERPFGP